LTGIIPSSVWKIGESPRPGAAKYKRSGWNLESDLPRSTDLEEHVKRVLEMLRPGWDNMKKFTERFDAEISGVVYIVGDNIPAIHVDKASIKLMTELNAELDIDLYHFPSHSDEESECESD
jgi:hypothetical protein